MRIGLSVIGLSSLIILNATGQPQAAIPPTPAAPPSQPSPTLPPAMLQQQALPPGLQNRSQVLPGQDNANGVQPNGTTLSPAQGALPNQNGVPMQNEALTPADQALQIRVQQAAQPLFQAGNQGMAVQFFVRDGVARLVGTVPNAAAEEQLEALVQQVPGVTGVVDQLSVGGQPAVGGQPMAVGGISGQTVARGEDQGLLLRIRQTVLPQIEVAGNPVPINFTAQQGIVTINGTMPNLEQKRQLTALVRQVPGVMQVNNQVAVNAMIGNAANQNLPAAGLGQAGVLQPNNVTPEPNPGSTPMLNNTLIPTGRTNAVSLPPGLENRNSLPPGLQNRGQLPPGLGNQTNQVPRRSQ